MYGYGSQPGSAAAAMQHYPQPHLGAHNHPVYAPMDPSGLSMDDQDRRKLERKRLRNRMAASKCRQKKLERIAELEQQVSDEKLHGANLDREMAQVRAVLEDLQRKFVLHQQKGCPSGTIVCGTKPLNGI